MERRGGGKARRVGGEKVGGLMTEVRLKITRNV